uniref:Uncharacterized protein n=1 Tax=Romanomermis culicivorax TaxID=13658 RepID=A0A915K1H5_ROMCU
MSWFGHRKKHFFRELLTGKLANKGEVSGKVEKLNNKTSKPLHQLRFSSAHFYSTAYEFCDQWTHELFFSDTDYEKDTMFDTAIFFYYKKATKFLTGDKEREKNY